MQKCQTSALSPWLGHLCHELLHQCGVARRRSACGTAEVLAAWILVFLIFPLTIAQRFSLLFRSGELASQSNIVITWSASHVVVVLAQWADA